jgi:hypothetical protein
MDSASQERSQLLRRLADIEIARHREAEGCFAAALDGSLATGAVWPSSDLDFTIIPPPGTLKRHWVEWGVTDRIIWHKHITYRKALTELMEGYPRSFIQAAEGEFSQDANWFLDGLAVMEVIEDSEGFLAGVKGFVAERRFAPEVWKGRREALLRELHRLLKVAETAFLQGDGEGAYRELSGRTGLAAIAAQLWLEASKRIYSSKEQDGLLSCVTRERGRPEIHDLYRQVLGVEEDRVTVVLPILEVLGREALGLYQEMQRLTLEDHPLFNEVAVNEAYTRQQLETFLLAPTKGHPGFVYQNLMSFLFWANNLACQTALQYRDAEVPGSESFAEREERVRQLAEELKAALYATRSANERATASLTAARELARITERFV